MWRDLNLRWIMTRFESWSLYGWERRIIEDCHAADYQNIYIYIYTHT
jgi:hypothetical protein